MPQLLSVLLVSLSATLPLILADTSCFGAMQSGYCCPGTVLRKTAGSKSFDASDLICCKGEKPSVLLAPDSPTTCSSGTSVQLNEVSSGGSTSTSAGASSFLSLSASTFSPTSQFSSPFSTSSPPSASATGSQSSTTSSDASSTNTTTPASSSANGAAGKVVPVIGSLIAMGGIFLAI